MKYKGKEIKGKNREVIPIPRPSGPIIFIAEPVQSWREFDELVSKPIPPVLVKPGGAKLEDKQNPEYQKELEKYNTLRTHYTVLKSLEATEELEWESVDINKPSTWGHYEKELKEAGFTEIEIGRILTGIMRANCLDDDLIDEARNYFLHGQQGSVR